MAQTLSETSLQMTRNINASVAEVYSAWTDPGKMVQWMGPGEVTCESVDIDLNVGGKYRIHMKSNECEHPIAVGVYKEIDPEKKLVFTWAWEGSDMPDTLVTLTFAAEGAGTTLTLLHEGFPEQAVTDKHTEGWEGCLAGLIDFCS